MLLPQLRRVRWAVRATLVLGVAASVVANILHALDNPISQAIAAWPPLALLLTVELISRVPVHRRSLAFARLFATATIAGIAAWVSYWHMAGVAARYGETGASPYLLPLSVDGLIVVASICLVELGGRISSLEAEAIATAKAAREAAQSAAQVAAAAATQTPARLAPAALAPAALAPAASAPSAAAPASAPQIAAPGLMPVPAASHASSTDQASSAARASSAAASGIRRSTATAAALAEVAAALPRTGLPKTRGAEVSAFSPTLTRQGRSAMPARPPASPTPTPAPAVARTAKSGNPAKSAPKSAPRPRRSPAETIATAAKIKTRRPDITDVDLAAELGISVSRWRTIRREAGHNGDLRLAA